MICSQVSCALTKRIARLSCPLPNTSRLPRRPDVLCERSGAAPGGHRRPGDRGYRQGCALWPDLHEPDIRVYPPFPGSTAWRIRSSGSSASSATAQGLEERKQILYLLGPVGGGKSSLAERLKALMEVHPIYVLKAKDEISPVFENPSAFSTRSRWETCSRTATEFPGAGSPT